MLARTVIGLVMGAGVEMSFGKHFQALYQQLLRDAHRRARPAADRLVRLHAQRAAMVVVLEAALPITFNVAEGGRSIGQLR